MIDARAMAGTHDLLWITLDTLRYDVAQRLHHEGRTPTLSALAGPAGWQERHSPASFTYAAHQAFFAGFLPTPVAPGKHERPLALRFPGSETTTARTLVLEAPNLVEGFAGLGYRTVCIGGVGFFDARSPLGAVLPGLFQESHWSPELGVTQRDSTARQVDLALEVLGRLDPSQRVFLFLNVSAIHQPNHHYLAGKTADDLESHGAALAYVDSCLGRLFEAMGRRAPTLALVCSDHGTCYGEGGHEGHRVAHPAVWTVPYLEAVLP